MYLKKIIMAPNYIEAITMRDKRYPEISIAKDASKTMSQ